jgi:predicted transcriptional regulator YheO
VTCHGGTDGSASVTITGNIGALSYLWSNGANAPSISNLLAGSYTVTITESVNCKTVSTVVIAEPSAISVTCTNTNVTTNGGTDGTADVAASGGTVPYSYLWSTGATTSSITNLTSGTYTVTVSDANGCSDVCSSQITEPNCNLVTTASSTPVTCHGGTDGSASVTITGNIGALSYLWSNGANAPSISNLLAGSYTVTITESANCKSVSTVVITEPSAISIICSKIDVTTSGGSNGTASVAANGGTAPYSYLWSTGATTSSMTNLTAGTYTVTVNDANGCSDICTSQIIEPNCIPPSVGANQTLTCNANQAPTTSTLIAAPNGYTWYVLSQPNGASATISNSGAVSNMTKSGNYVFELIKDTDSGCKSSIQITVPSCTTPCPTTKCGTTSVRKL